MNRISSFLLKILSLVKFYYHFKSLNLEVVLLLLSKLDLTHTIREREVNIHHFI